MILWTLLITAFIALFMMVFTRYRYDDDRWVTWDILSDILIATVNLIGGIVSALKGDWASGINLTIAAWFFWMAWRKWRRWKNRKKATQALGAKSKALRDSLVKRMREGLRPSPVKVPI